MQHGHIEILKHFFESYDPKQEDHNTIYDPEAPMSLLSIALASAEPEVVWMILDKGLATAEDISHAWTTVTSLEGKRALLKKIGNNSLKYTEIQNLLMTYGGFTPPLTPKVPTQESSPKSPHNRGKRAHHFKTPREHTTQVQGSPDERMQHGVADSSWRLPENGERGKTRGRGRGRGRGHGRGRGRGRPN